MYILYLEKKYIETYIETRFFPSSYFFHLFYTRMIALVVNNILYFLFKIHFGFRITNQKWEFFKIYFIAWISLNGQKRQSLVRIGKFYCTRLIHPHIWYLQTSAYFGRCNIICVIHILNCWIIYQNAWPTLSIQNCQVISVIELHSYACKIHKKIFFLWMKF